MIWHKKPKNQSWEEFGREIGEDDREHQRLFYKLLKNVRQDNQHIIKQIKRMDDKIKMADKVIMERWNEFSESLLNGNDVEIQLNREDPTMKNQIENGISGAEVIEAIQECTKE